MLFISIYMGFDGLLYNSLQQYFTDNSMNEKSREERDGLITEYKTFLGCRAIFKPPSTECFVPF